MATKKAATRRTRAKPKALEAKPAKSEAAALRPAKPKATAANAKATAAKPAKSAKPEATAAKPAKPKATAAKPANPKAVDAWLAKLPNDQRAALQLLRKQIHATLPKVIETIAWGVPMYYAGTTPLFGFSAAKKHVALGVGPGTLAALREQLEGYDTGKAVIRFTPKQPLSGALVAKLVKTRLALYAAGEDE